MAKISNADKIRIRQVAKQLGADKSGSLGGLTSFISGNYVVPVILIGILIYIFYG